MKEKFTPPYPALGQKARRLFTQGYNFGFLKLDVRTTTINGTEFSSFCQEEIKEKTFFGALETKYKIKDKDGFTLTERWFTDSSISTELSWRDCPTGGLNFTLDGWFSPRSGDKAFTLRGGYMKECLTLNTAMECNTQGVVFTTSMVLGFKGLLAGIETKFHVGENRVTDLNFAAGYSDSDFILHTNVNNGTDFGGSVFHKVTPELDVGFDVKWSAASHANSLGIGGELKLDDRSSVRGKVLHSGHVGFGYEQKLRDGISIIFSTLLNLSSVESSDHKFGIALKFKA